MPGKFYLLSEKGDPNPVGTQEKQPRYCLLQQTTLIVVV